MHQSAIPGLARSMAANINTAALPTRQERERIERRRRDRHPQMTADQATQFTAYSIKSTQQVFEALEERKKAGQYPACNCQPYDDVFTCGRWNAQGFVIRKGEKALRVSSWVPIESKGEPAESAEDGEAAETSRARLKPQTLILFCRCQVDKAEPRQ